METPYSTTTIKRKANVGIPVDLIDTPNMEDIITKQLIKIEKKKQEKQRKNCLGYKMTEKRTPTS